MLRVLSTNDDFPIKTAEPVHSGKVRSVYWLTAEDSRQLIERRGYPVASDAPLAIMVVSDRISAFDCIWHGEGGLNGVPGKGAALNAISQHWFDTFREAGLARSHILEAPHPLCWVVQRARPVRIEAIARRYITGSMWRSYEQGERLFCGVQLPEGLRKDQLLPELLITPSTKGVLEGLEGIPAADDVNISRESILRHWSALGFMAPNDVDVYEELLRKGFDLIADKLSGVGQLFVDTKFEFGYAENAQGRQELIYMDEVGTPDSSRFWDAQAYMQGKVRENSKEEFRQALLALAPDPSVLLDKTRMVQRQHFAATTDLPEALLMSVSDTYRAMAERITGRSISIIQDPRGSIEAALFDDLGLARA